MCGRASLSLLVSLCLVLSSLVLSCLVYICICLQAGLGGGPSCASSVSCVWNIRAPLKGRKEGSTVSGPLPNLRVLVLGAAAAGPPSARRIPDDQQDLHLQRDGTWWRPGQVWSHSSRSANLEPDQLQSVCMSLLLVIPALVISALSRYAVCVSIAGIMKVGRASLCKYLFRVRRYTRYMSPPPCRAPARPQAAALR